MEFIFIFAPRLVAELCSVVGEIKCYVIASTLLTNIYKN